jgi:hypothetical protein
MREQGINHFAEARAPIARFGPAASGAVGRTP